MPHAKHGCFLSVALSISGNTLVQYLDKMMYGKKVTSSHRKGITELLIQDAVDTQLLKHAVEECGYKVLDIRCEPYEKQGFSLFKRK